MTLTNRDHLQPETIANIRALIDAGMPCTCWLDRTPHAYICDWHDGFDEAVQLVRRGDPDEPTQTLAEFFAAIEAEAKCQFSDFVDVVESIRNDRENR